MIPWAGLRQRLRPELRQRPLPDLRRRPRPVLLQRLRPGLLQRPRPGLLQRPRPTFDNAVGATSSARSVLHWSTPAATWVNARGVIFVDALRCDLGQRPQSDLGQRLPCYLGQRLSPFATGEASPTIGDAFTAGAGLSQRVRGRLVATPDLCNSCSTRRLDNKRLDLTRAGPGGP